MTRVARRWIVRVAWATLLGMCLPGLAGFAVTQAADDSPGDAAATAVDVERRIELTLLDEDLERYEALVVKRRGIAETLDALYLALGTAVREAEAGGATRIERLMVEVERTEGERAEVLARERTLVERIRDRRRRLELYVSELAALGQRRGVEEGALGGTWRVVFLPSEQRGTFRLKQNGTLITGTYQLQGGWTGSLQGTLVNRKVFLVRIDAKLGRSMELEGYLSEDGGKILGSWLNYELAGAEGSTGEWSAQKSGGS